MKGYAMLKIGSVGWVEKERPACGAMDAICKPLAIAICTSDVHTVWEGAVGERHDMILGHECCAEVVEVGADVKDFKPGDPCSCSCNHPRLEFTGSPGRIRDAFRRHAGRLEIF